MMTTSTFVGTTAGTCDCRAPFLVMAAILTNTFWKWDVYVWMGAFIAFSCGAREMVLAGTIASTSDGTDERTIIIIVDHAAIT